MRDLIVRLPVIVSDSGSAECAVVKVSPLESVRELLSSSEVGCSSFRTVLSFARFFKLLGGSLKLDDLGFSARSDVVSGLFNLDTC